ncbi:MAG: N-acetylmuramoyl-L-alanine amidase, partial [Paludibacteraceae bacterium]|nr:N-acetylmuramoyl-L-alanine amidase [Paludibacteraceae bacterium]
MSSKHILTLLAACAFAVSSQAFTIVIDAGHGAHDAGAVGSLSKEKNINLRHAILLGDIIKERNPEVKVIYTRDKDVFVELNE